MGAVRERTEIMCGDEVARSLHKQNGARATGEPKRPVFMAAFQRVRFAAGQRSTGWIRGTRNASGLGDEMRVVPD